ncbi:MAG TPA: hypothetical protein VFV19_01605 [Candidatus Polarisedimenticolaceae bacterium]|nr:hypothetical protein [Candidatus Polarisedimenticolaceae bacterium]
MRAPSAVEESEPDTLQIAFVGIIGTILLVTAVAFLQGLYERVQRAEVQRKVVDVTPLELQTLRVHQQEVLQAQAWVDRAAGAVSIPIDRAMDLLARDPDLKAVPLPLVPAAAPAGGAKK